MSARKKTADDAEGKKPARRPRSTQKFVRNLYGTPLGIRLASGERLDLRPRGQRGDLAPLSKEQEKDAKIILNAGVTVEVIGEAEATKVVQGQTTNQQSYHPALQILRDSNDQPYPQQAVEVTEDPQTEGDVVALLKDGEIVTQHVPGKGQQVVRDAGRSVGPRVAQGVTGSDQEMAELLRADDAAKNGSSLTDILGGYNIDR
jgi:hypothetical protein